MFLVYWSILFSTVICDEQVIDEYTYIEVLSISPPGMEGVLLGSGSSDSIPMSEDGTGTLTFTFNVPNITLIKAMFWVRGADEIQVTFQLNGIILEEVC